MRGVFILAILLLTSALSFAQGDTLVAVADTIDLVPGIPREYDILANDTLPAGDTLSHVTFSTGPNFCRVTPGAKWRFTFTAPYADSRDMINVTYKLWMKSGDTCSATILANIHEKGSDFLDINNVRAKFHAVGSQFFGENDTCMFEVPKGSGKSTIFLNTLWIGGKDAAGNLHVAAAKYGMGYFSPPWYRFDFYPGPVMDSTAYSFSTDTLWNHIWNLKKMDIDYHRAHFWEAGYQPVRDILTWPGNGDTTLGQAWKLAPFSDRNGDGRYDPFDGDYPEIRGDQALWFIFNDDRDWHDESQGAKLRIEIHGMAYAFDLPGDTAFKNSVFLNYRILNRSQNTYDSTLFGMYTDMDIGYYADDFTGSDVERGMYFCYNGKPVDGYGQYNAYGANPPAQSVTLLGGPVMDADGIDNPRYDNLGAQLCSASVNGLNFGDSVADNERLGLQGFLYPYSGLTWYYQTQPVYAADYYRVLCEKFRDGIHLVYGGGGHPGYGGYGPDCNFMFPGESDTLNWGVGCTAPNGSRNWTEESAGNNPQDRCSLGITGPVTFSPGEQKELDIAFTWARDYTNPDPHAAVDKLRLLTDHIRKSFETNTLPGGGPFYGIGDLQQPEQATVNIYPNPATDRVTIDFGSEATGGSRMVEILTGHGVSVEKIAIGGNQKIVVFNLAGVPAGVYLIRVSTGDDVFVKKLVVIH